MKTNCGAPPLVISMHMLALPIARRELLVLSRAATTWHKRLISTVAVFLVGVLFAFIYHYAGQVALNPAMHLLGGVLSLICLFAGVSLTADSIAQERRDGTLALLFLTNLSPFEIVLGKLLAHAMLGFYTVLYALPLLSMSMIFGGMRFRDVLLYVISALNALFFSAAAGLFASSVCRDRRKANGLGTIIVVLFWLGLPSLAMLLTFTAAPQWVINTVEWLSVNLPGSMGVGFGGLLPSASPRWWDLAWPQILAWAFIGLTVWRVKRRFDDQPPPPKRRLREIWKAISYGRPVTRLKLRRRLLDRNPFMWLASRDRFQAIAIWIVSLSMMAFIGFHLFRGPLGLAIAIAASLAVVLQLSFSGAAGAQLLTEYQQGTLEMVLSTPLSAQEVIHGQLAAARRYYRILFGLAFLLLWAGILLLAAQSGSRRLLGIIVLAVGSGLFLLQFYALGWVGMWCVVKAPDPKKAHATAFFLVTILPGIIFGFTVVSMQFLWWLASINFPAILARINFSPGPNLLLPFVFLLAFANCIYWLLRAKRELPRELRLFAFRRYAQQDRLTLFGHLGRFAGRCLARARGHKTAPTG